MAEEEALRAIDAKLGALLAISIDQYLRETGVARPKSRSIDKMLSDVGLSARDIAALLGKTDRAVHLVLAGNRSSKSNKTSKRTASRTAGSHSTIDGLTEE